MYILYLRVIKMKRKVWRSGNSWVVTIPNELAEKLNLMNRRLIDFDIKNVFEETEKMFDDLFTDFGNNFIGARTKNEFDKVSKFRQPLADVYDNDKEIIVKVEVPGADKKDIIVTPVDNGIEIKVEKKSEIRKEDEKNGIYKLERSYAGFYRYFSLPSYADLDKIDANYKDGILELKIKKKEVKNQLKRRQIEIR